MMMMMKIAQDFAGNDFRDRDKSLKPGWMKQKIFFPLSIEEIKEDRGKNKEDKENLDRLTKNWGK
jgi:hypothetical protein